MLDVSLVPDVVPVPGYLPVVRYVVPVHQHRAPTTIDNSRSTLEIQEI